MIGYNVLNNGQCCPIVGIESDRPVKDSSRISEPKTYIILYDTYNLIINLKTWNPVKRRCIQFN